MRNMTSLLALGAINFAAATGDAGSAAPTPRPRAVVVPDTEVVITDGIPAGGNSTLAVTRKAQNILVNNVEEQTIETSVKDVETEGDIYQAFLEVFGTTNVKSAASFPAIRSNVYGAKKGRGTRAVVLTMSGNIIVMPNGSKYGTVYSRAVKEKGLFCIVYFDQADEPVNPHCAVNFYATSTLPAATGAAASDDLY